MKSDFVKIFIILLLFPSYIFTQELWKQSDGPAGGTVENLIVSIEGTIFATLAHQGIIRSSDNASSWTKTNHGLTTTDVLAILAHPNGFLFAGTVSDGIFRSSDNGENWINVKQINDLPFSDNIRSLTYDNLGYIYAGAQFSGIFISTNNGNTWNRFNIGLTTRNIETMTSTPNGYVFAGTMTGLFRSTNHGNSWQKLNIGIQAADISSLNVTNDGVLYAATYGQGIFRTFDNGNTWQKINFGLASITGNQLPVIYSLASDFKNQVYAGSFLDGVFYLNKTEDRWYRINYNLSDESVYCLAPLPGNELLAGTSRGGIFATNTNYVDWIEKNNGINATDIYDLSVGTDGYVFAAVFGRGIYSTQDGGKKWNRDISGLTTPYVFSLVTNSQGFLFAGTYDGQISGVPYGHGVFRSTDNGSNWIATNNGISSNWVNKLAINTFNNDLYAATINGNAIYKSSNNGNSWTSVISGQTANAFTFNSNGDIFAAIYNSGVIRSSNNGLDWVSVNNGLSEGPALIAANSGVLEKNYRRHARFIEAPGSEKSESFQSDNSSQNITSLTIDGHGTIYAGAYTEIFRSTDNGDNWILIKSNLGSGWVTSLIFDSNNNLYAVINGSIYISKDYGFTWEEYNNGITNDIENLLVTSSNHLYAGSRGGSVFQSVSASTLNLISFNALLEGSVVKFCLEVETDLSDQIIMIEKSTDKIKWRTVAAVTPEKPGSKTYIFSENQGTASKYYYRLFRLDDGKKSILSENVLINKVVAVSDFKLEQNYPNPFNPSTAISYSVPQIDDKGFQWVVIKIYDAIGNEISTLVNENKLPGNYTVYFDASKYSSGVYYYTLRADNFRESKKMMLTK